jgi:hypothetical protein
MAGKGLSGQLGELQDIPGRLLQEKKETGLQKHAVS